MLVCEYNDDLTDNWLISPYPYNYAYVAGDYSTLEYHAATPQTTPHWNPNYHGIVSNQQMYLSSGYPFRLFVSDGNGDVKEGDYGARNWTSPGVRFRCNFTGDYEDDQSSESYFFG
jgi:hypothetical protein